MPFVRSLYLSLLFLFFSITVSAQQYPATFLWRISGNGLTKPSYLYGTMHVQDRRLFFFGDSIYNAIEQSEGFSIEINPAEMMDSLFKSLDNEDRSDFLKNYLDSKEYKKIAKKLEKKLKMPADKITTKRLAKYKKDVLAKDKRKDDMLTFMDMYLYNIAEKQGKITGGIEDVADQFELVNELGVLDIDQYLKDDTTQLMNSLEAMKQRYINRNLTGINDIINGTYTDSYKDILLIKRNAKMAIRMDSLAHIRNSFFAVGAAHLPGDSGVITLLQKRGFWVEPVISTKYIVPEEYTYVTKDLPWIRVSDENNVITVEMPGAPSPVRSNTEVPMKLYANLAESSCYGLAVTFVTQDEINTDTILSKIADKYQESGLEILSKKKLTYKGMPGLELTVLQGEENHFIYRIFLNGNKLILILFGAPKKEQLNSPDIARFFNSLQFNNTDSIAQKPWEEFRNEKNAFAIKFPSKVKYSSRAVPDATLAADQYMAVDISDGSYYFMLITDTEPAFYIEDDSTYFESYKNKLNENTHKGVKEFNITTVKGFPACHYTAVQKEDGLDFAMQGYLIRRGNRTYSPLAVTPKEKADFPQVTNFFRSLEILDYKKTNWKKVFLPDSSLSTMMPADLTHEDVPNEFLFKDAVDQVLKEVDSASQFIDSNHHTIDVNPITHSSINKNTAVNYSIEVEKISPYYWAVDDTTYFKAKANSFKKYNDTIISYNYINSMNAVDVLIKFNGTHMYKKIRFMLNGDTTYTLSAVFPEELLSDANNRSFFDNTVFTKKQPTTIFINKSAKLFDALKSNDSATVEAAKDQLGKIDFTKKDLPYLLDGMLYSYPKNIEEYRTINDMIAGSMRPINDASVIDFVEKHYQPVNDSVKELPMLLLTLLAENTSDTAYALLKKLLIQKKPLCGSAHKLGYAMEDSLQLTKSLFPEISTLYQDSILGGDIIKLAVALLDSNYIPSEFVLLNEEGVIANALKQFKELKTDKDAYPNNNEAILAMLGKLNTKKSNDLLLKYTALSQTWVANNAITFLLKNNQTVPLANIKKLAADKEWRTDFYNSLKKINKTSLFPNEFYSQQKFAESYIYTQLLYDDESEINKIDYLTVKTGDVKGTSKRFVLCKVKIYEGESYHLAICGPFNKDQAIAEIADTDKYIQILYDEDFSASTMEEKFAKYLEELNKR